MEPAVIRHQQIATLPIDKLRPNPRNTRTHSKKQICQLANSIARFGWTYPILVDENSVILAGHARYSAAQLLGCRKVPVIVVSGLSDAEKRALALADNKIAANAGWDRQLLAGELGELATLLPECDLDLNITGFEPAEIDSLLGDLGDPEQDPADEVPALEKQAISRIGDFWRFGVALGEPGLDGSLEFGDALEYAAADLLAGDFGEQPLDQVDPGRRCWCEVQLEARMLGEPSLHLWSCGSCSCRRSHARRGAWLRPG